MAERLNEWIEKQRRLRPFWKQPFGRSERWRRVVAESCGGWSQVRSEQVLMVSADTPSIGRHRLLVPCVAVLAVAVMLSPDPAGVGTHTQLGLGTCTVLLLSGWPCPMCGMTTTFSLLAHGHIVDGVLNQPFGSVLFGLTLGSVGLALMELISPRGRLSSATDWLLKRDYLVVLITFAGLTGSWIYKTLLINGYLWWS